MLCCRVVSEEGLRTVLDQRCLNLSCRQSVAGHVHHIVNTASDPVVALVVATSAVSSELLIVSYISITTTTYSALT